MKKVINSISLTRLTINESFQFHSTILSYLKECDALVLTAYLARYDEAVEEYDVAVKQILASEETEKLADLDGVRRHDYNFYTRLNKLNTEHFNPEVADAAKSVAIVIKGYKNPVNLSYPAETSILHNLCQDLKNEKYAPLVAKTGLTEWVVELDRANKEFDKVFKLRNDEQSEHIVNKAKEERLKVESLYNTLMFMAEAELIKGNAEIREYVNRINNLIDYYKTILAKRDTLNKKKREEKKNENNNKPDNGDNNNGDNNNKPDNGDNNNEDEEIEL
jgi:hypothetical protein